MRQIRYFSRQNTIVRVVLTLAIVSMATLAQAKTDTVLLLHTNDFHDHLRSDYDGSGGLPQVATYIQQERSQRVDTIVLDAGDVMNKGDLLPHVTQGAAIYEALRVIAPDAGVPGNHDWRFGASRLSELQTIAGYPMLGIDVRNKDGSPVLPASMVFDVDGVRVGVIGSTRSTPRALADGLTFLNPAETAKAIAKEAARLEDQTDLLIFLGHRNSKECRAYAEAAPTIDVFVSGHSHEKLDKPIIVAKTGALIVQAGSLAEFVGRVELVVDLDTNKVVSHKSSLVAMDAAKFAPDAKVLAIIDLGQAKSCPIATRKLTERTKPQVGANLSRLVAKALLAKSEADVALADPSALKAGLPAGVIDGNAVHRLYEMNATLDVVTLPMKGATLKACLETVTLKNNKRLQPAGFGGKGASAIELERTYKVAMTSGVAKKLKSNKSLGLAGAELTPCDFNVVDATTEYLDESK